MPSEYLAQSRAHRTRGIIERDDQDRLWQRTSGIEDILCERISIQEDDEDAGVGTNLRFDGSCPIVEELMPEV
jgi:hypothetical protein